MIMKRTPISYYGGKQRMLKIIIPLIPPHKSYIEPFFGGGAVFFAKGPSKLEVINDMSDNVINFYRVMRLRFDDLLQEVEASLFSESLHRKANQIFNNPTGIDEVLRAWAFWYMTNFSFINEPSGGWKWDCGSANSHSGRVFQNKRDQFKRYGDRLSNVQISCRDALRVVRDRDRADAFFYLDPPYPGSDQGHYEGYTLEDLEDLLRILETLKGKFLLSNFRQDIIDEYVERNGWHYHEHEMNSSAKRKTSKRKIEVLISNYNGTQKLDL